MKNRHTSDSPPDMAGFIANPGNFLPEAMARMNINNPPTGETPNEIRVRLWNLRGDMLDLQSDYRVARRTLGAKE